MFREKEPYYYDAAEEKAYTKDEFKERCEKILANIAMRAAGEYVDTDKIIILSNN